MVLAIPPSNAYLTFEWRSYSGNGAVDRPQSGRGHRVRGHAALAATLETMVESWILPSQSLILRAKPGDGIIAPPREFNSWQPFPPAEPYPLGSYIWRD